MTHVQYPRYVVVLTGLPPNDERFKPAVSRGVLWLFMALTIVEGSILWYLIHAFRNG